MSATAVGGEIPLSQYQLKDADSEQSNGCEWILEIAEEIRIEALKIARLSNNQ